MRKCIREVSTLAAVVLLLFLCCPALHAVRNGSEGEDWLKWTPETRAVYIQGYFTGFWEGLGTGCHQGASVLTSGPSYLRAVKKCNESYPRPNVDPITFAPLVTSFYEAYPRLRSVDIRDVLYEGVMGLSIAQIHEHFMKSNYR